MSRRIARWLCLLLALAALPALAQTRAWLERDQIAYGETVALNITTDQSVTQVDYGPLRAQFDIGGQTVRRSFELVNGRSRTTSVFSVGLRPRAPGAYTVPALAVGGERTAPLRLLVMPPAVQPAGGGSDVFVETTVDASQPYVQQAVGVTVRLNYAVPLLSGQLDLDPPADASLQRVGEDITYQRELGGRRYNVVERRFLLIPERSGTLSLPGARFNGMSGGGYFDAMFDGGRQPLSAAAPVTKLQVRPIPAGAPQPWLPLRKLALRYLQAPAQARVGTAATVEIEAIADGATAAQLPQLVVADVPGVQAFAEPAQSDEQFVDGRPRTVMRRRIALVPSRPGALTVPGPRIAWWDAVAGEARIAELPPLRLQVAPGASADAASADASPTPDVSPTQAQTQPASSDAAFPWRRALPWLLLAVVAMLVALLWLRRKPAQQAAMDTPGSVAPPAIPLASALQSGDLAAIGRALAQDAGLATDDLDAVRAHLADAAQADAVRRLQAARWGDDDVAPALAALRTAFARGARWRQAGRKAAPLLPPLYPER